MIKGKCILTIVLIICLIFIIFYFIYLSRLDTQYAIDFANVFRNYNIDDIDQYFSDDTLILCNGKKEYYKEVRKNVIKVCESKQYQFKNGSSYGYSEDKILNNIINIKIYLHGELKGKSFGDCLINMKLKRTKLFDFKIVSVECNEPIFEYLFFNN